MQKKKLKVHFNKNTSKILDFYGAIQHLSCLNDMDTELYQKIKKMGYLDNIINFYNTHRDIKEKSYLITYDNINPFNYKNLVTLEQLLSFTTIDDFKECALQKSEEQLRQLIIKSLTTEKNINEYLNNPFKVFNLVENCGKNSEIKSRLSNALANPKKALIEYFDYLYLFKDDFEKIYSKNQDYINERAEYYIEKLEHQGIDYLYLNIGDIFKMNLNYLNKYSQIELVISMFAPIGLGYEFTSNLIIIGTEHDIIKNLESELRNEIKVSIFKNLGDSTRFKIFTAIGQGIDNNKDLAEHVHVSKPTISYHLSNLVNTGMVTVDANSKYTINTRLPNENGDKKRYKH